MNLFKVCALALGFIVVSGCGGGGKEPLALFLQALSEPSISPAQLNTAFVELLDAESRERLVARADTLSQSLGIPIRPDEVIRIDGLPLGLRLGNFEVIKDGSAVEIAFANVDKNAKLMASPVTWRVVREGEQLRLALPPEALGAVAVPSERLP